MDMRLIFEDGTVDTVPYSLTWMCYAIAHLRIPGQTEPPRPVLAEYQIEGRDY